MGKLPLGKLSLRKMFILEVATWEAALGKMPLGKYLTPIYNICCKGFGLGLVDKSIPGLG